MLLLDCQDLGEMRPTRYGDSPQYNRSINRTRVSFSELFVSVLDVIPTLYSTKNTNFTERIKLADQYLNGNRQEKMNLSAAQIESQVRIAREAFPALTPTSPTQLTLGFPGCQPFIITLPPTYSRDPPTIHQEGQPRVLIITSHWNPAFQLVDVCRELQLIAEFRPPPPAVVPPEVRPALESASINASEVLSRESRLNVLRKIPVIRDIEQRRDMNLQAIAHARREGEDILARADQDLNEVKRLLGEVENLRGQLSNAEAGQAKLQVESMKRKEAQLLAEAAGFDQQVSQLQSALEGGRVKIQDFCAQMMELKEKQNYARVLADIISRQRKSLEMSG